MGRERELARLDGLIGDAACGRGRVVVVRGEAGIGKTRLVREALGRCERVGFDACMGAAEEMEQRRPFGVIAEVLGVDEARDRPRAQIGELLRGEGDRGAGVGGDSAALESRVAELALEHVERLSARRPVMLAIEDLHWADPSSLLAVHRFAHAAAGLRLLLVCTLRPYPERRELRALLASLDGVGASTFDLEPLDAEAVRTLAEALAAAPPGPALLRRLEAVGGNPLYLTELLAALAREGTLLVSRDGTAEAPAGGPPPSLRLTILRRLSALPEATVEALRVGSVLGSRFTVSELALALSVPVARLAEVVRAALSAGVLVEAGERLAFRHDLIREVVYEDVPVPIRRALHRELGTRLGEAGAPSERVAAHMLRGADPGDAEAIEWLRRAGREAAPRAPVIAGELLEGALALTPAGAPSRDEIRAELVEPLVWSGRGADVEVLCRDALTQADGPEQEHHFRLGLARGLLTQGRLLEARAEFDRLAHDPALAEQARVLVAAYAANLGAFLGAEEAAERAEALLEMGGAGPAADIARLALAASALFSGRADVALERLDELARRGAGEWLQVRLLRGMALLELDRFDEARATLTSGLRSGIAAGASAGLAFYHVTLVSVEYHAGRLDAVVAEYEAGLRLARETGQRWLVANHALVALTAMHRGELEQAERAVLAAEAEGAEVGPQLGVALVPLARARLAEARGAKAAAAAAAGSACEIARRYGLRSQLALFAPHLMRIALAAADRELAATVCADADAVAALLPVASRRGCALHCRGLLDADPEALLEAVAVLRSSGRPLDLGLGLESAACVLARAHRDAEARRLGAEALGLYDDADAAGDSDRARARFREAGLRVGVRGARGRPRSGWESLTNAELRVVGLVAAGHSNPEIAERLYVSRRTVRAHVSSALLKLGLSSRVELAAEAVRRGL